MLDRHELEEPYVTLADRIARGASRRLDARGDMTGLWDADRISQAISNLIGNAVQHGAIAST